MSCASSVSGACLPRLHPWSLRRVPPGTAQRGQSERVTFGPTYLAPMQHGSTARPALPVPAATESRDRFLFPSQGAHERWPPRRLAVRSAEPRSHLAGVRRTPCRGSLREQFFRPKLLYLPPRTRLPRGSREHDWSSCLALRGRPTPSVFALRFRSHADPAEGAPPKRRWRQSALCRCPPIVCGSPDRAAQSSLPRTLYPWAPKTLGSANVAVLQR